MNDPRAFGLPARHDEEFAQIEAALAHHRMILAQLCGLARRDRAPIRRQAALMPMNGRSRPSLGMAS